MILIGLKLKNLSVSIKKAHELDMRTARFLLKYSIHSVNKTHAAEYNNEVSELRSNSKLWCNWKRTDCYRVDSRSVSHLSGICY